MSQPVVFGSYELLDRIAQGGMAEVWRARSRGVAGFEKTVVIKRVLPSLMAKPGFADLLIREAKIAARLSHPRIVQIFELGEDGGSYFIAMEYVHGRSLDHAMAYRGGARDDGLSTALRVWIVAEAAGALDHAHRRKGDEGRPLQIVHRDVSPQNILLGYEGEVKVADFGIARADEQGLGRGEDPKILRGKYAYMSPEQARGEPLDRRSDVFSLGIVLYELLTGLRMFRGKSSQETLHLVRAADIPPLSAEALGIDAHLAGVLARCLAPARDDRYSWASDLYGDLTQWLFRRGEPVGQPFLADAMARMFPPEDQISPNKLRVDVLMRAYQDATAISAAGAMLESPSAAEASTDDAAHKTAAMPRSRRMKVERRRLALLVARRRPGEGEPFARACEQASGIVFGSHEDLRVAAFGHAAGVERGVAHAARAALELRRHLRLESMGRTDPVPAMVVLDGEGRIVEDIAAEPDEELIARARVLLEGAPPGELRVAPELVSELSLAFRIGEGIAQAPIIEGFRARGDRDAVALRRRAPLVGRRDELRMLSEAVIATLEGEHRMVQLVAEPGAGKSRLLAELRAMISTRDVHVVSGRADEADAERTLAVLGDLARDLCGVEPEDTPSERFAKVERLRVLNLAPREVRLCGELLGMAYPVAREERPGRPRGIEIVVALRKAIAQLAHDRAVVVVLEDLQWLDDSSRQLLSLFLRGLARPRVMVVMTRRPGALVPHLPGTIFRLAPLARDATGRLFAAAVGARAVEPELAALVERESGGNPGWIEVLATEARAAGSLRIEEGVARATSVLPQSLPATARSLVAARLAQLRPIERTLLVVAAAFEGAVATEVICAIEGVVGSAAHRQLRRLLARRLLVPAAGGASFDHDVHDVLGKWGGDDGTTAVARVEIPARMLQRAILETIDPGDLRRLHARIVATLERIGADKTPEGMRQLAHHASRSVDRRRAPEYLVRSSELAHRAGDVLGASADLALASRILREEGDDDPGGDRSIELALRAVRLALDQGALARAGSVLDELAAVHEGRGRPATRLMLATARAETALLADRAEDAIAAMRAVEHALGGVDAAARAAGRYALGRALLEAWHVEDAISVLAEAVEAYREAADVAGRGRALALLALAEARGDRVREADDTAEEALALAARLGHGELRYAALAAMGAAEEAAGDRRGAAMRLREAVEVAAQEKLDSEVPIAALRAALACMRAGETLEAAQRAEQALRLARRRKIERIQVLGVALQAALAMQENPDTSWIPPIVRAIDRLEAMGRPGDAALAVELLAHANRALGDDAAAERAMVRGVDLARRAGWLSLARALSG